MGNTAATLPIPVYIPGSSPRLWGTLANSSQIRTNYRFIPTPVGNTITGKNNVKSMPVHPHACGEHTVCVVRPRTKSGSSPRLWGTRRSGTLMRFLRRFIPTPVGNTTEMERCRQEGPVHPHACGEHENQGSHSGAKSGSSPRLWGTLRKAPDFHAIDRFIPTPVGNTRRSRMAYNRFSVHPHACGEHSRCGQYCSHRYGSSPRLWGTQRGQQPKGHGQRFIPTPVGNTSGGSGLRSFMAVHPHACGEHLQVALLVLQAFGSSPRLWGTQESAILK